MGVIFHLCACTERSGYWSPGAPLAMMMGSAIFSATALLALGLLGSEAFVVPTASLGQGSFVRSQGGARWTTRAPPRRSSAARAMCMETTADFKNGMTIDVDGSPCKILEFLHVKPGKGSAFVRTKIKNLLTGNSLEKTFRAGESVTRSQVETYDLQFTYKEDDFYKFMDTRTFEEVSVDVKTVGDKAGFMVEGMTLEALFFNGKPIDVILPKQMVYEVKDTDPGAKGNTAQGGSKPATLEGGAVINVPLFIKIGEKIRVDTEGKKYMNRANE